MAATLEGAQITLSAAPQTLTALIRAADPTFLNGLPAAPWMLRADSANTGQVRILKRPLDTVANRLSFLAAGEAAAIDISTCGVSSDGIWLLSSVGGDTVWVLGVVL